MIHGRSRLQRYSRCADWGYIHSVASGKAAAAATASAAAAAGPQPLNAEDGAVAPISRIPIIGNGDIMSFTEWEDHLAMGAINSTCMLARGALIKPWLPTEVKERRHWDISA